MPAASPTRRTVASTCCGFPPRRDVTPRARVGACQAPVRPLVAKKGDSNPPTFSLQIRGCGSIMVGGASWSVTDGGLQRKPCKWPVSPIKGTTERAPILHLKPTALVAGGGGQFKGFDPRPPLWESQRSCRRRRRQSELWWLKKGVRGPSRFPCKTRVSERCASRGFGGPVESACKSALFIVTGTTKNHQNGRGHRNGHQRVESEARLALAPAWPGVARLRESERGPRCGSPSDRAGGIGAFADVATHFPT
jgi:hypothetical protein